MIHFVYFGTFLSYHLSCKVERVELKYTKKKKENKIRYASDFAVNYPLKPLIKEKYEEFNFSNFNNHRSFLVYAIKPASSQVSFLKMLSLKRSGQFESSVSLQFSFLSELPYHGIYGVFLPQ